MAVPRNRHSNSRKNKKRSHHAMKGITVAKCPNCAKMHLPHRVCMHCGFYNGKSVLENDTPE